MTAMLEQMQFTPDEVHPVDAEFAHLYATASGEGAMVAAKSKVAICGLARNIGKILPLTKARIQSLARRFRDYTVLVYENDSSDETKSLLAEWAAEDPAHVVVELEHHDRPHLVGFEPERTQALAEYRTRLQQMVREHCPDADYIIMLDMDLLGGWSLTGIMNGIGWLSQNQSWAAMGSVSIFRHPRLTVGKDTPWCHYDAWAYRWLGWTSRIGPWFTFWLPPPGALPIEVNSAFGGLAIYKTAAWLSGEYTGGDCEHVGLHRTMKEKGWKVFINPSQRCVVTWLAEDEEPSDGGNHSDNFD